MLWSVIRTGSAAVQRRAAVPAHSPAFPVPVRILGQSMAPAISQQVGDWRLEPLHPATILPASTACNRRWARAVVVFHELPATPPARLSAARRHAVSVAQALPPMAIAVEGSTLRLLPVLGWLLIAVIRALLLGLAAEVAALLLLDPCLVVVTEGG